jgi:hypothetical protein
MLIVVIGAGCSSTKKKPACPKAKLLGKPCGTFTVTAEDVAIDITQQGEFEGQPEYPGFRVTYNPSQCPPCRGSLKLVQAIHSPGYLDANFDCLKAWSKIGDVCYPGYHECHSARRDDSDLSYTDSPKSKQPSTTSLNKITVCAICDNPAANYGCVNFSWDQKNRKLVDVTSGTPTAPVPPGPVWQEAEERPRPWEE